MVTQSLLAGLSDSPGKSAASADQQDVTPKQISTSSASDSHSSDHQNAVDNQPAPASTNTTLSRHQQPNGLSARAKHTLDSSASGRLVNELCFIQIYHTAKNFHWTKILPNQAALALQKYPCYKG